MRRTINIKFIIQISKILYLKQGYEGILSNELMQDAYTFATAKNIVINIDTIMKWATSVRVI